MGPSLLIIIALVLCGPNKSSSCHDLGVYDAGSNQATAVNPSTVSEPAPQGAESPVSHEAPANGTVPRSSAPATA
jgi:hypothetical protein